MSEDTPLQEVERAVRSTGCAWNSGKGGEFIIMGTRAQLLAFVTKLRESMAQRVTDLQTANDSLALTLASYQMTVANMQHMPKLMTAKETRIKELEEEVRICDQLLERRNAVLNLLPCPDHGEGCMPYAEDWIKARLTVPGPDQQTTMLNQRAEVEQLMFDAARGKRPMPDAKELRAWALRLGTPHDHDKWGRGVA
jgi:hypothetical protein